MYNHHFGFSEAPFSIAPDPRYLYLSEQHREALAHLVYGIGDHGGFVVLTGEVGTGKTTVCRCLLQQVPAHIDIAVIVNPKLNAHELLQTICDELGVAQAEEKPSAKQLLDALNMFLLATHARGRNAILIVDEAQNLAPDVLEQLRLLTNLETNERKLLQLILLGQPELNTLLAQPSLRQLSQRITARYHLRPLARDEVVSYIEHRVAVAGGRGQLFSKAAIAKIFRFSKGIPRLINLLCDRALLGVYSENGGEVDTAMIRRAAREVLPQQRSQRGLPDFSWIQFAVGSAIAAALLIGIYFAWQQRAVFLTPATDAVANDKEWRESLQSTEGDKAIALGELTNVWRGASGEKEKITECPQSTPDISCLQLEQIKIDDVTRYNVPLVLVLHTDATTPRYVVLKRIQADRADIYFAARDWHVALKDLSPLWRGEVLILAPAPVAQLPLQPGATDSLVAWFDTQLYRHFHRNERRWQREVYDRSEQLADGASKSAWLVSHYLALREQPSTTVYDATLLSNVKQFQQEQGLASNGIIDLATLLALSRTSMPDVPALNRVADGRGS
ncbi:MAG: peptidoglycan-binding domain 1 [Verrucomicrobiaceae bacterium]|nr:peptidoglycan-binding domain 1 [Verrucomicrobiaceae bacterium]